MRTGRKSKGVGEKEERSERETLWGYDISLLRPVSLMEIQELQCGCLS